MKDEYNSEKDKIDIRVSRSTNDSSLSLFFSRNIKIFVILEIILIFTIGYFFFIKPEFKTLNIDKESIIVKKDKLEKLENYKIKLEQLKNTKQTIEQKNNDYVQKLYDILPQKQDLPQIMAQVEALVDSYGLVLGSIQISAPQENVETATDTTNAPMGENIKEIQVSVLVIGGDGSYDKVKQFLEGIEGHIRLFDVTSFSFDPTMTTYSIIFKTYYLDNGQKDN